MHRHHILPKRLGGNDEPDNVTPPISVQLHAVLHKDLWQHYGCVEDYIAWKALSGRITSEEARLAAARAGQARSEKYKNRRIQPGIANKETCSAGGKAAAPKLVAWQKANRDEFLEMLRKNGSAGLGREWSAVRRLKGGKPHTAETKQKIAASMRLYRARLREVKPSGGD